ncbi:MAG TPA: hypothetical protein VFN68_13245 [Acidimicrobiales bacterium]|nr:hypothetical protein [Acidimicrobiales bacterium]
MTAPTPILTGRVVDYDEAVGLGTVEDAGGRRFGFHCTQIADGTRRIDAGTRVAFEVVAARRGSWEAARLTRL